MSVPYRFTGRRSSSYRQPLYGAGSGVANGLPAGWVADAYFISTLPTVDPMIVNSLWYNSTEIVLSAAVAPVTLWSIAPGVGFAVSGTEGLQDFTPVSIDYTISNNGNQSIPWTAVSTDPWITLAPASGTLAGGGTVVVTATAVQAQLAALPVGGEPATITFAGTGVSDITRSATATVNAPTSTAWSMTPATTFDVAGTEGVEDYTPGTIAYTISNDGTESIPWTAVSTDTWIALSPSSGTLAGGATQVVDAFAIQATLAALPAGTEPATVTFAGTGVANITRAASAVVSAVAEAWSATPATTFDVTGTEGLQDYTPTSIAYTLSNDGPSTLNWTAVSTDTWISLSPASGALTTGSTVVVTATAVQANLAALPVGTEPATVTFAADLGLADITRAASAVVSAAAEAWSMTPATTFDVTGTEGVEDYTPTSIAYTLSNDGPSTLNWTAVSTDTWVTLSPASGALTTGSTVVVTATAVQANLAALPVGTEPATITFAADLGLGDITRAASAVVSGVETGWTDWATSGDSRVIYVSATGNDANDGLSEGLPKLTISAGAALLRDTFPDQLLMKRGDTFANQGIPIPFTRGGRSTTERMVIGAYGSTALARPIITSSGTFFGVAFGTTTNHMALMSLDIRPVTVPDAGDAILIGGDGQTNWHIEDCQISGFGVAMNIRAGAAQNENFTLHRNVVVDNYPNMGILVENTNNLTMTDNIIVRNGWQPGTTAASTQTRNCYIQSNCDNVIFERNHTHLSSSNGVQVRPGGSVLDNLCVRNASGIHFGFRYGDAPKVGGTSGVCSRNVVLNSEDHDAVAGGQGIAIGNVNATGVVAQHNVVAGGVSAIFVGDGFLLETANNGFADMDIALMDLSENVVYDNDTPIRFTGTVGTSLTNATIQDNKMSTSSATTINSRIWSSGSDFTGVTTDVNFVGNTISSARIAGERMRYNNTDHTIADFITATAATGTVEAAPSFTDATRGVDTYIDLIDATTGSTEADFFSRVVLQRRGAWDTALETTAINAYIRAGFDVVIGAPVTAWSLTPATTFDVAGTEGLQDYTPTSLAYTISNDGNQPIPWTAASTDAWITLSPASGTLAGGSTVVVTATGVQATLAALAVGTEPATVTFAGTGVADITRAASAVVSAATVTAWSLSPATEFDVTGTEGVEDYTPTSIAYTISNDGTESIPWTAVSTDTWITLAPASGTLAGGGTVVVTATAVQANLAALPVGTEPATVTFAGTGVSDITRAASAVVSAAAGETGWTDFATSGDSRVIYVSATGSDANDGLSEGLPKLTLAGGEALLRNGFPDHLLLKRGDTFADQRFSLPSTRTGRSDSERMVFGVYGPEADGRAIITVPVDDFFYNIGFGDGRSHLVFQSLDISAPNRTASPQCIAFGPNTGDNITFEDVRIHGFGTGVGVGSGTGLTNVKFHRCLIEGNDTGNGLTVDNVAGLEITECIFYQNGWEDGVTAASTLRRNVLIGPDCTNVTYSRNHSHRASSHGALVKTGGTVEDNLFVRNVDALHYGYSFDSASATGGVTGSLARNVVLDSEDHDAVAGGRGISVGNINATGASVLNNLIANGTSALAATAYGWFWATATGGSDQSILNMTFTNNVTANQDRPLYITGTIGTTIASTAVLDCSLFTSQGADARRHTYFGPDWAAGLTFSNVAMFTSSPASTWTNYGGVTHSVAEWVTATGATGTTETAPSFTDGTRGVDTYIDLIDATTGSTDVDFFNRLLLQRRGAWATALETTAVNTYIRAGFDVVIP